MESLFTSRRTRAVVALVSALLLLSAATVAVTSPLPPGPVTDYAMPVSGPSVKIVGSSGDVAASCTNDATTTARILRDGYPMGSVHVPSDSDITSITWYGTNVAGVAGVAGYDQDGVAITQTVAADRICELPTAIACFKYVLPVTDAAGSLYFHFER
jgi:hypothetical protein